MMTRTQVSVLCPTALRQRAVANVAAYPWAAAMRKQIVAAAEAWIKLPDDELRALMFAPTIRRSWFVWSNGHCPACKKSVPMFEWKVSAMTQPWKMWCPHCGEHFPTNDFGKFYRSGLDPSGGFEPNRADRSLLFHTAHPDPGDPLHKFGVDDGNGYVEDDNRWRFIGAYLVFGQWKQAVVAGINHLAAAYVVTGEPTYARKAGVLLNRVAELYPTFDFGTQGVMYETVCNGPPFAGYVSTWHDACEETREMALAYDQVREALPENWRNNIEERILRDALHHPNKIHNNYPKTEIAQLLFQAILGEDYRPLLDSVLEKATAVDGVTGEKGLTTYVPWTLHGVASLFAQFARLDAGWLGAMLQRHPGLLAMFRFHVDTICLGKYYPLVGDCGAFGQPPLRFVGPLLPNVELNVPYRGVWFDRTPGMMPSMYSLFWQLYQATGDVAFAQVLYQANKNSVDGLPHDLFAENPDVAQATIHEVIGREGAQFQLGSVNKSQWRLAILRSGRGRHARAAWLNYDSGGGHGHFDGMNLGLFAHGLDLMPDFGYPPVQFGGWETPKVAWYKKTAAHNTVVVDGNDQPGSWNVRLDGSVTLWAEGRSFRAMRASGPKMIAGQQFERTVVMVDISDRDFYVLDIFRVVGGREHAKFFHSHFGTITTRGLTLRPASDYGHHTLMRNFACDPSPSPGWSSDWLIEDRHRHLPTGTEVHLRYTDLTEGAETFTCEGWINAADPSVTAEAWIPRLMVRRRADTEPLASTFISVIEPYEAESNIAQIRRVPVGCDSDVAVEIVLKDGSSDLLFALDSAQASRVLDLPDWEFQLNGELSWIRRAANRSVTHAALCRGNSVRMGRFTLDRRGQSDFAEWP